MNDSFMRNRVIPYLKHHASEFRDIFKELMYPEIEYCFHCNATLTDRGEGPRLCEQCTKQIIPWEQPVCQLCGRHIMIEVRCPECLYDSEFTWARSYGPYQGLIREGIQEFKYQGVQGWGPLFGHLLYRVWSENLAQMHIDYTVSVPLHPDRLAERGFNQAELMAKVFAEKSGIPWIDALERISSRSSQTTRTRFERKIAMRGIFEAKPGIGDLIKNKRIALIDDVYTTGSTVNECAEALTRAGAFRVFVLTVAR